MDTPLALGVRILITGTPFLLSSVACSFFGADLSTTICSGIELPLLVLVASGFLVFAAYAAKGCMYIEKMQAKAVSFVPSFFSVLGVPGFEPV